VARAALVVIYDHVKGPRANPRAQYGPARDGEDTGWAAERGEGASDTTLIDLREDTDKFTVHDPSVMSI
jgi:hypothetical protein